VQREAFCDALIALKSFSAGKHILKVHMEIATEARRSQSERALHHCLSEWRHSRHYSRPRRRGVYVLWFCS